MVPKLSSACYTRFTRNCPGNENNNAPYPNLCYKQIRQFSGRVRCAMDVVTILVVGLIVVAYVVGSLTSSVETETELPHLYR